MSEFRGGLRTCLPSDDEQQRELCEPTISPPAERMVLTWMVMDWVRHGMWYHGMSGWHSCTLFCSISTLDMQFLFNPKA